MIAAKEAIRAARAMLGTPYGSGAGEIDCINLVKHVIRQSAGGVKKYTTAGTNALWDSYSAAKKYKDLTWRERGVTGAKAGMLAFKESGGDVHHVGLVTGEGTVIHASSAAGKVVETKLSAAEGWNLLGQHRYIAVSTAEEKAAATGAYVVHAGGGLRQRKAPGGAYMQMIPDGTQLLVEQVRNGWGRVRYNQRDGWVSMDYLTPPEDD